MFLPWHRFFLYFHERILAKLLGDDDKFALPFWNWDNQSPDPPLANVIPLAFANPMYDNKVQSSLYDERRSRCTKWPNLIDLQTALECANQTLELQTSLRQWNNRLMYTQLVTAAPISRLFFGESYKLGSAPGRGAGTLEVVPHGTVHFWTGDPNATIPFSDMGIFQYAALDPIFYAHHGNIDRLWEVWKSLPGGNRKDLSQADYLNTQFLFYDENAALVKVQISQALNINNFRSGTHYSHEFQQLLDLLPTSSLAEQNVINYTFTECECSSLVPNRVSAVH
jgi:polyphenol oxidase